jgi:hypothetical protein
MAGHSPRHGDFLHHDARAVVTVAGHGGVSIWNTRTERAVTRRNGGERLCGDAGDWGAVSILGGQDRGARRRA